jgi:hypothetical protein
MIMKKMMLAVAMMFTIGTAFAFTGEEAVNKQTLTAFNKEFADAKNVTWTVGNDYYKAAFTMNDQKLFAFYNAEGQFLAVTRYISSLQLPLTLQSGLKKNYSKYWISDLFEMANPDGTAYYLTLENADGRVTLKSVNGEEWTVYQKSKKA